MRSNWKHNEPSVTQDCPPDNTSEYCIQQVRDWKITGIPVHPEVAMEVAAWYHSSGAPAIVAFSHSGTITDDLLEELAKERSLTFLSPLDREEVDAVIAYVRAVKGEFRDSQLLMEVAYSASQGGYVVKARASAEAEWSVFEDTSDQIDELLALARDVMTGG